jgi:hypothetical protein
MVNNLDILVRVLDAVEVLSGLSKEDVLFAIHTRPSLEPILGWHGIITMGFLKELNWSPSDYLLAIDDLYKCLENVEYPTEPYIGFIHWFYLSGEVDSDIEIAIYLLCDYGAEVHDLFYTPLIAQNFYDYQLEVIAHLKREGVKIELG